MQPILSLGRSQATPRTTPSPSGEEVATPWRSQDSIPIRLVSSDAADGDCPVLAVLQHALDGLCCRFHQPSRWAGRARAQGWSSESRGCCPESAGKAAPPCPALGLLCPAVCGCVFTHVWQCAQVCGCRLRSCGCSGARRAPPTALQCDARKLDSLDTTPLEPQKVPGLDRVQGPTLLAGAPLPGGGGGLWEGGQWGAANPRTPGLGPLARPDLSVVTGAGPAAVPR